MAEVEKTTKKRRGPKVFGRWRSAAEAKVEFARHLESLEAERPRSARRERGPSSGERLPVVELDAAALMSPVERLPTAPKMVSWSGQHLWVVLVAYEVDPYELVSSLGTPRLEPRSALDVAKPTCYWCGDVWSLLRGKSPCSGRER